MKFQCCFVLLCVFLFSCSAKTENREESDEHKISLEQVAGLDYYQLNDLDSTRQQQGENTILFVGTRQEILRGTGWIKVSAATEKNPGSNRNDIPRKWKTSQGVYLGIPIDSLEAINGAPFYVQLVNDKLTIANWEGGKLVGSGVWVDFVIEGNHQPEPFMLSRDIIKNGWKVRCATFTFYNNVSLVNWNEPKLLSKGYPGDYAFLSFKEMTAADLDEFNPNSMRIMRNEVFARHGYIFKSDDLKDYFYAKAWYKPQFDNVDDKLSELEKANVKLLQERETRNRFSPLAKLIRKLPFLKLPYHLSTTEPPPVYIDSIIGYPDGQVDAMKKAGLTGLLPDTSKIFALVWFGDPPDVGTESEPLDLGGLPAISDEVAVYITTFDKNMNHIQTVIARPYVSLIYSDATNSGCTLTESSSSVLNRDWTYASEYSAVRSCPTAGDDLKTNYGDSYSGKINKDGTIELLYQHL